MHRSFYQAWIVEFVATLFIIYICIANGCGRLDIIKVWECWHLGYFLGLRWTRSSSSSTPLEAYLALCFMAIPSFFYNLSSLYHLYPWFMLVLFFNLLNTLHNLANYEFNFRLPFNIYLMVWSIPTLSSKHLPCSTPNYWLPLRSHIACLILWLSI